MRPAFFRLSELRRFFEFARSERRLTSIRDWDGGDALVLRHDVDLDLSGTAGVSELEQQLGIPATYCVMTTSDLYNVAAPASRAVLRSLAEAGFDIGLHFWPAAYGSADRAQLAARVRNEARLLEDITGQPVTSLSLHNPSANGLYPAFDGFRGAYGAELFVPGRYLSDSRMIVGEDPFAFVSRTRGGVAQLLLHPEHFTEQGLGYDEIFDRIERRRMAIIDGYMSVNATYAQDVTGGLSATLDRRARDRG
ncbi:MAG: hypothetical protein FJ034_00115 [Chloroflexi bacterium]|nr:hypothetical protein [Chloroflexota bacterium]